MVLKGDYPKTIIKKGDFNYANEMVEFIKENYLDINILVAAYPRSTHIQIVSVQILIFL